MRRAGEVIERETGDNTTGRGEGRAASGIVEHMVTVGVPRLSEEGGSMMIEEKGRVVDSGI